MGVMLKGEGEERKFYLRIVAQLKDPPYQRHANNNKLDTPYASVTQPLTSLKPTAFYYNYKKRSLPIAIAAAAATTTT